jgi:hypothetical protein
MGNDRMHRVRVAVFVALLLGLAGYLYSGAPQHPLIVLDQKAVLAVAPPIADLELGEGPNLVAYDADFTDGSSWRPDGVAVVPDAATAPDKTNTAIRLVERLHSGWHRIETTLFGARAGEVHTISLYVKAAERAQFEFDMRDDKFRKSGVVTFDLDRKAVAAESGDVTDSGIQELPDGWFRCWAAMPYDTSVAVFNFSLTTADGPIYWSSGGSSLLIWGVQFEPGDHPGGYSKPTEKAVKLAQPISGLEPGEGPNLAADSADFTESNWKAENVALVPDAAIAPDKKNAAVQLVERPQNGWHRIETTVFGARAGEIYTLSLYVKPMERRQIQFEMRDAKGGKYGVARFDLDRKAVVAEKADVSDAGIQELPDGWFRCWAAMPYDTNLATFNFALITARKPIYQGNGGAALLIWGVQFEPGDHPGGYAKPMEKVLRLAQPVSGFELGEGPNLIASNTDFTDRSWKADSAALVPNAAIAPDETSTAARLVEVARNDRHRIETTVSGATAGEVHTLSLYVKPAEREQIQLEMRDAKAGKYGSVRFDLDRKAIVAETADVSGSGIQELPDGWFRCWAAMPYDTGLATFDFSLISARGPIYQGNGGVGLFIWGVQFETGDHPGGYAMPTGKPPEPGRLRRMFGVVERALQRISQ